MSIQVQTYEVEEVQGECGIMAADAEAQELIEKLGLKGQRELLNPETCTRFPYRKMTKAERVVFALLFPHQQKLEEFKDSILPIRVLQVAAFVREYEGAPCPIIKVWHSGSAKEDPLLVGHTNEYGGELYLLARWGEAIVPFDELIDRAKTLWIAKAKAMIFKETEKWKSDLGNLENLAVEAVRSGEITSAENSYDLNRVI